MNNKNKENKKITTKLKKASPNEVGKILKEYFKSIT